MSKRALVGQHADARRESLRGVLGSMGPKRERVGLAVGDEGHGGLAPQCRAAWPRAWAQPCRGEMRARLVDGPPLLAERGVPSAIELLDHRRRSSSASQRPWRSPRGRSPRRMTRWAKPTECPMRDVEAWDRGGGRPPAARAPSLCLIDALALPSGRRVSGVDGAVRSSAGADERRAALLSTRAATTGHRPRSKRGSSVSSTASPSVHGGRAPRRPSPPRLARRGKRPLVEQAGPRCRSSRAGGRRRLRRAPRTTRRARGAGCSSGEVVDSARG
jgi:hypothetical protein